MKIYVLKDKMTGTLINCFMSENCESAMRTMRVMIDSYTANGNEPILAVIKDCDLFEVEFDGSKKIIEVSQLFNKPKAK